jgi:hypothetical protein
MTITQKKIEELTTTYTPSALDDFSNKYFAVGCADWGEARKTALNAILSSALHVESAIGNLIDGTSHVVEFDAAYADTGYCIVKFDVYKIVDYDGAETRQSLSVKNFIPLVGGFTFETFEASSASNQLILDYYILNR